MTTWNWRRPAPNTVVARWFARNRHPDAFVCGVRVLSGTVPGEGPRWRFRPSAVDPFRPDESVSMRHGDVPLTFTVDDDPPRPATRARHALLTATHDTGCIELSVPLGDLVRFGVVL